MMTNKKEYFICSNYNISNEEENTQPQNIPVNHWNVSLENTSNLKPNSRITVKCIKHNGVLSLDNGIVDASICDDSGTIQQNGIESNGRFTMLSNHEIHFTDFKISSTFQPNRNTQYKIRMYLNGNVGFSQPFTINP
jgi:hypothetical protein